jgi:hypothetical protein
MGYERRSLSLLTQEGFWRPISDLHIVPCQGDIFSLEGDVATLLKLAGMNGVISYLADRDVYALPLRYRHDNGLYMSFFWVFKDFCTPDVGYMQNTGWIRKRADVARMTTADYICLILINALASVFEERPDIPEGPVENLVDVMFTMLQGTLQEYPFLQADITPHYARAVDEDDDDLPIAYTVRFADGILSLCEDGILSLPPTVCKLRVPFSTQLRTVKPFVLDRNALSWPN